MNLFGPPDAYLADTLMSMLVCFVAAMSALLSLGVIVYVAMVVEMLRGSGAWARRHRLGAARLSPR
jgi:hypothetical protein